MPTVRANEIDQCYEVRGEGPPLVFAHGGFVDLQMWDPQVAHFAARDQVIRYDLRGHGKTGPSLRPRYTIELLADDTNST